VIILRLALLALPLMLTRPAAAQTRVLVVPEGKSVVVPPRGAAPTFRGRSAPLAARARLAPDDAVPLGVESAPAASPLLALVPLVAAAALAATLPGSGGGGGGSGPVRTR
jgi:hypothetical protein